MFYSFNLRELSPQQLVTGYRAEQHPEIKILGRNVEEIREEFMTALSLYL